MTFNPYSPPAAPLPMSEPGRPQLVVIAMWLFAGSCALGYINAYFIRGHLPRTLPSFAGAVIGILIIAGLMLAIYARRNWARWIVILMLLTNIAVLPAALVRMNVYFDSLMYIAQAAMQLAVIVLLLLPKSGRWYRSRKTVNLTPPRDLA